MTEDTEKQLFVYAGETEDLPAMFGVDVVEELVQAWIKHITETKND